MRLTKVLIADDHKEFRTVVHQYLSGFPELLVVGEAIDGDDAIAKADELTPDIILMDIAMPNKNGLEATAIIKGRMSEVNIILTTLYDYAIYRKRAQEVGANFFWLKSELKSNLETMLRGGLGTLQRS